MSSTPRIAVVGAGPGGLTLARLLYCSGIPCTIFEGDSTRYRATNGGTLDLHEDSGQVAVREAQLWDEFQKFARIDTGRPEIDRQYLRDMLLDSIPSEYIRWGHRLKSVDEDGTLYFDNDSTASGWDLIVGADGAWSKIQRVLSTVQPFYSGISALELWTEDIDTLDPDIATMVGNGSHFIFGNETGRCLLTQRQDKGVVRTLAYMRVPEAFLANNGVDNGHREYDEWAPELKSLLTTFDRPVVPRQLYMLPPGIRWPHKKGFTLIGDSVHLMTPFAGIGVNMAMHDALDLAHAIIGAKGGDLEAAVYGFEKKMWPRAEKAAKLTLESTLSRFDRDGIDTLKARLQKAVESQGPREKKIEVLPVVEKFGEMSLS